MDLSPHTDWENYFDGYKANFTATSASGWYNRYGLNFNNYAVDSGNNALSNLYNATQAPIGSQACWSSANNTYLYCQQNGAAMIDMFFTSKGVK